MHRKAVQQASSQICSVKLSSFKRNVTSAIQESKGKAYQLEKTVNEAREQPKLSLTATVTTGNKSLFEMKIFQMLKKKM